MTIDGNEAATAANDNQVDRVSWTEYVSWLEAAGADGSADALDDDFALEADVAQQLLAAIYAISPPTPEEEAEIAVILEHIAHLRAMGPEATERLARQER